MGKPLVSLKNVQLSVHNFKLSIDDLNLKAGEIHAIMGENGSGKSLLMQLVNGSINPDSGEVVIPESRKGWGTSSKNEDVLYIHQDLDMMDNLTVAENLFFHNLPYKNKLLKVIDYERLRYDFQLLINELNLPMTTDHRVKDLGLAQKQILEFCKAYISDAKVVILDEPSGALSQSELQLLYDIVEHIKKKGVGIFYITHRLDDVFSIADRVTVLKRGKILGTMEVEDSTEEAIIALLSNHLTQNRYPKIKVAKGKTILSVRDLGYEDKLKNINFDLKEGEVLGVTGLAGSGRTLLANCLFGNTNYKGSIYINKHLQRLDSPQSAILNGIALVPENRNDESIFKTLDINENVALPSFNRFSKNYVINQEYMRQTVLDYIVKVNIPNPGGDSLSHYSGSSLQKALFAKWIMNRAKIFILDEPTRGVDIASKIDIYNFINDLIRHKVSVIYISSDIEEIFGICDRVAVLSDNTLACDIPTSDTSIEEIVTLATTNN